MKMKIGDRVFITASNEDLQDNGYCGNLNHGDTGVISAISELTREVVLNNEDKNNSCWIRIEGVEPWPYTTSPIDYTGCHPVIAESLKRGESIECLVWMEVCSQASLQRTIAAYVTGRYISTNLLSYSKAEPVVTKPKKLKPLKECLCLLLENGYEMDCCGGWIKGKKCINAKELLEYSELAYYEDFLLED